MKISFLLLSFIGMTRLVYAQTIYLKGGASVSSLDYRVNGVKVSTSSQTDFHLGVGVATEIASKLVFQFGAAYSGLATVPNSTSGFLIGSAVVKYHPLKEFNLYVGPYGALPISKEFGLGSDYGFTPGIEYFFTNNLGVGISYLYGIGTNTRALQFSFIYRFKSLQLKNAGY